MKRIVLITVLAVLLVSAVGTTAVMARGPEKTALSCVSPTMPPPFVGEAFQITGTLSYGTSGTPVPDRLVTVFTSTDEKKWTEVGSVTTDDSGQYTVTTSQETAGTYYYRAVFDRDTCFKKVTSPTSEVTVNRLPGSGTSYATVSFFELNNYGWFVAKLACYYSTDGGATWKESDHTGGIAIGGASGIVSLDGLGVPGGALVKIHVIVVGGKDRTGSEVFYYYADHNAVWHGPVWTYDISGSTWNPTLDGPYRVIY